MSVTTRVFIPGSAPFPKAKTCRRLAKQETLSATECLQLMGCKITNDDLAWLSVNDAEYSMVPESSSRVVVLRELLQ